MVLPPVPAQPPVVGAPAPAEDAAPKKTRRSRFSRKGSTQDDAQSDTPAVDEASQAEQTAVLPVVDPRAQQPLPRAWREAAPRSAESVQDKVPHWLFRPEPGQAGSEAPTARMPAVEPRADAGSTAGSGARTGRYDWAEETPLDDLPSLTDQLLGSKEEWAQWHAEHPDQDQGPAEGRDGR
jgi:dTMP kinase